MNEKKFDLILAGGGALGLATAWECSRRGLSVCIYESREWGSGASGAGTGLLITRGARVFHSDFKAYNVRSVRENWASFAAQVARDAGMSDLLQRRGAWVRVDAMGRQKLLDQLEREKAYGWRQENSPPSIYKDVLGDLEPEDSWFSFADELCVDNTKLMAALVSACLARGVEMRIGQPEFQRINGTWHALDSQGETLAHAPIFCVCAGWWTQRILEPLGYNLPLVAVRGQAALVPGLGLNGPVLHLGEHFHVLPRGPHLLVGATTEARVEEEIADPAGLEWLAHYYRTLLPRAPEFHPIKSWGGLRPRTKDRLPAMGWLDADLGLAVNAGHYKNGLCMAPRAALHMADLIQGKSAPELEPFAPDRWMRKQAKARGQ